MNADEIRRAIIFRQIKEAEARGDFIRLPDGSLISSLHIDALVDVELAEIEEGLNRGQ